MSPAGAPSKTGARHSSQDPEVQSLSQGLSYRGSEASPIVQWTRRAEPWPRVGCRGPPLGAICLTLAAKEDQSWGVTIQSEVWLSKAGRLSTWFPETRGTLCTGSEGSAGAHVLYAMTQVPRGRELKEEEGAICSAAKCRHASQRQVRIFASQDKSPWVSEGFIMCWLPYDSHPGPLEALHDLPSSPKGD